jgi:hypothetical protein
MWETRVNRRILCAFALLVLAIVASRGSLVGALWVVGGLAAGAAAAPAVTAWRQWLAIPIVLILSAVAYWVAGRPNSAMVDPFLGLCAVAVGAASRLAFRSPNNHRVRAADVFIFIGLAGALLGGLVLHAYIRPLALIPLTIGIALSYQDRIRQWFG